jgi:acylphosphatase
MAGLRLGAAEILVEGRVQGVGYRTFAQRRAQERGLTGYAVNLHTGQVKIRVEGSREAIDGYLRDLEAGPPLARVERVAVSPVAYTGRYPAFAIRFAESR